MDLEHLISDLTSLKAALKPNADVGVRVGDKITKVLAVGIHQGAAYMVLEDPPSAAHVKGSKSPKVDEKDLRKPKKG